MVSNYISPASPAEKSGRWAGFGRCSCQRWFMVLSFYFLIIGGTYGQGQDQSKAATSNMELPHSGRVVFIGNSLIEEAGKYGILEWLFLNAWPEKKLSFRNLGWSGDTANGKARSYISRPPEPYDLLLQQIDTLNPALVVIGYGNVEAYEGSAGLDDFEKNLVRLLRDIDNMGAQSVLLSTIPQFSPVDLNIDVKERNSHLERYSEKIRQVADDHNTTFVDLFSVMMDQGQNGYTDEGIHLNGEGYFKVGETILNTLGKPILQWQLTIDARKQQVDAALDMDVNVQMINRTDIELQVFSTTPPVFAEDRMFSSPKLIVGGLKKGVYALKIDGQHIFAGSSSDFADGVDVRQGRAVYLARTIQELYHEINDLYFWQYRPLNRTYLVGFRRYEQGQNTYELGLNSLFIDRLQKKIWDMNTNEPQTIQIVRINK